MGGCVVYSMGGSCDGGAVAFLVCSLVAFPVCSMVMMHGDDAAAGLPLALKEQEAAPSGCGGTTKRGWERVTRHVSMSTSAAHKGRTCGHATMHHLGDAPSSLFRHHPAFASVRGLVFPGSGPARSSREQCWVYIPSDV